jgi:hypothetical protein
MGVLGLDPLLFLTTEDSFTRDLMVDLAKRMFEYRTMLFKAQAIEIANAVGKMLGG